MVHTEANVSLNQSLVKTQMNCQDENEKIGASLGRPGSLKRSNLLQNDTREMGIGKSMRRGSLLVLASLIAVLGSVICTESSFRESKQSTGSNSEVTDEPYLAGCEVGLTPDPDVGLSADIEYSSSVSLQSNTESSIDSLGDISKFSMDQTGIAPAILNDQQMKFLKARGQGSSIWYAVQYGNVQFMVIELDSEIYPARIVSPSGAIVDISSPKSRSYEETNDIFATVTTSEGRYFMIPDGLWKKMQSAPVSESMFSPPVILVNGNAIVANRVAFSANLRNQILRVVASSIVDDFFKALPADGTEIVDVVLTSARGYKRLAIDSLADKGKQDVYRVCVFCLVQDNKISKGGYLEDKMKIESLISDDSLEQIFWSVQHTSARTVFIPESYPSSQQFLISLDNGEFFSLSDDDISKIVELQASDQLLNTWFKESSTKQKASDANLAPTVFYEDKTYLLNIEIAKKMFLDGKQGAFEPQVSSIVKLSVNKAESDNHQLSISEKDLADWFLEGKTVTGLFLKQNSMGVSKAWPFVLQVEDGVEHQYFLNVRLIKAALSLIPKGSIELDKEVTEFIKVRQNSLHFELHDKEEMKLAAKEWAQVSHNGKSVFLSPDRLKELYKLELNEVFEDYKNQKTLGSNERLVNIDNEKFVFKFNHLRRMLSEGYLNNQEIENKVRHMLKLDTNSEKKQLSRSIIFDLQTSFTGTCEGSFVNETLCKGTFKGEYHHSTSPKKDDSSTKGTQFGFTCTGIFDRKGCKGKLEFQTKVNNTVLDVQSIGYSPLSIGECGPNTNLTYRSAQQNITVNCSTTFNVESQMCVGAGFFRKEVLDNGATRARSKVYCQGSLDLTTLECASAEMNSFQCLEPRSQSEVDICGDHYVRRRCMEGGDFNGCYVSSPKNKEIICIGGVFDGENCISSTYVVSGPDKTFFTSSYCDGDYKSFKSCDGYFSGKQIKCKTGDITMENNKTKICSDFETIGAMSCKGKLTENGCVGDYSGVVVLNKTYKYSIVANDIKKESFSEFPTSTFKGELIGFTELDNENSAPWRELSMECKEGLIDSDFTCKKAKIRGSVRGKEGWRHVSMACQGTLNYDDLKCQDKEMTVSICESVNSLSSLPKCEGSLVHFTCPEGGDFKGCKDPAQKTGEINCNMGKWDGEHCVEKEMIIPLNETVYYVGTCDGNYEENNSCDGVFFGREVECSGSLLASGSVCYYQDDSKFICRGRIDRHGCHGAFDGYAIIRQDFVRVLTKNDSKVDISGKITESETRISFINSTHPANEKIKLGVDRELKAICRRSFNPSTKECEDADVNITNDYTPNSTYIRARCAGILNLETLDCLEGQFSYYSCNSSQTFPDNTKCRGIYAHMDCRNGGNPKKCFKKNGDDVEVYCDGVYSEGFCKPFHLPQLPIIMVNESYYLVGDCSSRITDNECKGIFTGAKVVNCSSKDAIHNQTIFDKCVPIPGENFGTCIGSVGNYGCKGQYKIALEINSSTWNFMSSENSHYDFNTVSGSSKLIKRSMGEEDKVYVAIACQSEFSIRSLKCKKTILQFVDASYSEQAPGMAQTISAVCMNSSYDIKNLACRDGEYLYYDCIGKSHKYISEKKGVKFTCLGDLTYSRCSNGGRHNECFSKGDNDYTKDCINSYFDGEMCLKDKPAENTELKITSLGSYTTTDTDGQEVIFESFRIDKFHMFGATANRMVIRENMLSSLELVNGKLMDDNSVVKIEMNQNPTEMVIDEGVLHKINFKNFALDELPIREFAINDNAQFIRVLFKNMIIHQFMFTNMTTDNSVIRRLKVNKDHELNDYGVNELKMAKGFGTIQLRDVELYLPYLKASVLDNWMNDPETKIDLSFRLPLVEGIQIFPFKVILDPEERKVHFEFPELTIEDRSLDAVQLTDFILESRSFSSNPVAAEEVVKSYEQYIREHPDEKNDLADFSAKTAEKLLRKLQRHKDGGKGKYEEESGSFELDTDLNVNSDVDFDLRP